MVSSRRLSTLLIIALTVCWWLATPAAAHTAFEAAEPADGSVVDGPVDEVVLVFTNEATPSGDGIQILDPTGQLRTVEATTVDGRTWVAPLDPPVGAGQVGVRWTVQAPDAHPISGGFTFTIARIGDTATGPERPASDSPPMSTGSNERSNEVAVEESTEVGRSEEGSADLAAFLSMNDTSTGSFDLLALVGRVLGLEGTAVAIGGFVFASAVLRGDRRDGKSVMVWVRRSAALVVVGALAEAIAQVAISSGAWSALVVPARLASTAFSSFGVALALRVAGAVMLIAGVRARSRDTDARQWVPARAEELVGAGTGSRSGPMPSLDAEFWHENQRSPVPSARANLVAPVADPFIAVVGLILLAMSYLFDGHTVTVGNRYLTGVADLAHVIGGSVWAGGVLTLVGVLLRRRQRDDEPHALLLVLRFSIVATVALVVVAVAGVALAVAVLDSPAELWATEWGRFLIAKVLIVGLAVAVGGYNHWVLIPSLEHDPSSAGIWRRFRLVVSLEATVMVAVVVTTALLVGAAS